MHLPRLIAVIVGACLAACGASASAPSSPAAEGVDAYLRALKTDDARAAYDLLSSEQKSSLSYEEFEESWKSGRAEREHQTRALESSRKVEPDHGERAVVTYTDGRTIGVLREGGSWRLESELVSRTHAGTPRDALTIFAAALKAKDFDGLLRVLTAPRREAIRRRVGDFTTSLGEHLGDKISFVGDDRAEIHWSKDGVRYKVVFLKEGDEWRVDDVDARPLEVEPDEPEKTE